MGNLYLISDLDERMLKIAIEDPGEEATICLLQDAVYLACRGIRGRIAEEALKRGLKIYASKEDVSRRGLRELLLPGVRLANYDEIIDLVFSHDKVINL